MSIKNLISPPAAQTENSIALLWDKPENIQDVKHYQICNNENIVGESLSTAFTVTNLESGIEYEFFVCAVSQDGLISGKSNRVRVKTKLQTEIFDISGFGAIGDGKTINTVAIQNAINACPRGGKIIVPKGVFVSGALFLKSDMTLYIEEGGVLLGSGNLFDYPLMQYRFEGLETQCYASLINTQDGNHENITIAGLGKIDANGCILRKQQLAENKGKPGRAICLRNVKNLYLTDFTVKQSPAWCLHFIYCSHVSINGIKVYTRADEDGTRYKNIVNGDGIDPDSSNDVYIFNTMIASQDDCIAIKSGKNEEGRKVGIPSENIRIKNCLFKSGFGVAMGSEMSGGIRNVVVQDCVFENAYSVGSIKAPRGRGGIIENIVYKDCKIKNFDKDHHDCEWFRGAIYIDNFYSHVEFDVDKAEKLDDTTPVIRNITFENIEVETVAGNAIYLSGLPESPLTDIKLKNIHAVGKYGLKANNIKGLVMENVTVESKEDVAYQFHQVERVNQ